MQWSGEKCLERLACLMSNSMACAWAMENLAIVHTQMALKVYRTIKRHVCILKLVKVVYGKWEAGMASDQQNGLHQNLYRVYYIYTESILLKNCIDMPFG